MTKKRLKVGLIGEQAASEYLKEHGYEIVETNYRCRLGEIDIVARDRQTVVIVEVRTRTSFSYGAPEESITAAKAKKLHLLARYYLKSLSCGEVSSRIDLVAVILNKKDNSVVKINHICGILGG